MRGTRVQCRQTRRIPGLIPTYAGNTCCRNYRGFYGWAHPHVCGEHMTVSFHRMTPPGSSPRMRGTPGCSTPARKEKGLIPTYAGNTRPIAGLPRSYGAHPHVCGEHSMSCSICAASRGSSPRMRGTHQHTHGQLGSTGLIPTYAGNTPLHAPVWGWAVAHPHVCGEHPGLCTPQTKRAGSSPRMRGTRDSALNLIGDVGLIPTYAGNTIRGHYDRGGSWAHPHVCGEHSARMV